VKFYKLISVVLHPIVIPAIGVMLYFLAIPNNFENKQKLSILSLVFIATYFIPILILVLFKKLKLIDSYKTKSIHERKLPIVLMIGVFYLLGNTIENIQNLNDLTLLFFSTSLGLMIVYLLFYFQIKASIHLFTFGIFTGFFMAMSISYRQSFLVIILIILFLSGIVASARLHLKAHTQREVYLGFFIGLMLPILGIFILQ